MGKKIFGALVHASRPVRSRTQRSSRTFAVGRSTWTPMEEQSRVIQVSRRPENVARVVLCSTSPQKRGPPHVRGGERNCVCRR